MKKTKKRFDVCVVGGAGHVGLPLGIVFANKGLNVLIYDHNKKALNQIRSGSLPFMEHGAEPLLKKVLQNRRLLLSSDISDIAAASTVIITIGTPVDEFMNPDTCVMKKCVDPILAFLSGKPLVVLRSTVYPGSTQWLAQHLASQGVSCDVAFCPERVVQGFAIDELQKLPQIVSGTTPEAANRAAKLFGLIAPKIVRLQPIEAEFAKLFNNAYRYIQFATTNQFFMIVNSAGVDYSRVLEGMKKDYPRAGDIPSAGFSAGPCLFKDTMQLAAFSDNQFSLGHSAMVINEGLVLYLVGQIKKKYPLHKLTVGLLGMAFKANSDDTRSSLSYKLKKVLEFHAKKVLTTDPHVITDPAIRPLREVIRKSDLLILCVPHGAYRGLDLKAKPVVDIWNTFGQGLLI